MGRGQAGTHAGDARCGLRGRPASRLRHGATRDEYDWKGDEVRHVSIARLKTDNRLHVVVWCVRGDTLRVISFRRAKPKEEKLYERYGEGR